jgi:hypothetical protein
VTKAYQSVNEKPLSKFQLAAFLKENHLLEQKEGECF